MYAAVTRLARLPNAVGDEIGGCYHPFFPILSIHYATRIAYCTLCVARRELYVADLNFVN